MLVRVKMNKNKAIKLIDEMIENAKNNSNIEIEYRKKDIIDALEIKIEILK